VATDLIEDHAEVPKPVGEAHDLGDTVKRQCRCAVGKTRGFITAIDAECRFDQAP